MASDPMGLAGAGGAGAVPVFLQQLLENRLAEAEAARRQQALEAETRHREQLLAQQAARDRAEQERFDKTYGLQKQQYDEGKAERDLRIQDLQQKLTDAKTDRERVNAAAKLLEELHGPQVGAMVRAGLGKNFDVFDPTGDTAHKRRIEEIDRTTAGAREVARIRADATDEPKPLTQTAEANLVNNLAYRYNMVTKEYRTMRSAVGQMKGSLKYLDQLGTNDPVGQAVLVRFQKILDPESVVRESEYARTADGQALADRLVGAYQKMTEGGAGVRKSLLQDYVKVAEDFYNQQRVWAGAERGRVKKLLNRYNIPEDVVLAPDKDLDEPSSTPAVGGPGPSIGRINPKTGRLEKYN